MCAQAKLSPTWEQTFPNRLDELMRAIDGLDCFLQSQGAANRACYIARLAAEEMGTNIIKYGYDDDKEHTLTLRATAQADLFTLELIDDGHEFDPTTRTDPSNDLSIEDRKPGGWGITLVRQLAQSVHYERRDRKNRFTVTISTRSEHD